MCERERRRKMQNEKEKMLNVGERKEEENPE